jgi:hypothetical protein
MIRFHLDYQSDYRPYARLVLDMNGNGVPYNGDVKINDSPATERRTLLGVSP